MSEETISGICDGCGHHTQHLTICSGSSAVGVGICPECMPYNPKSTNDRHAPAEATTASTTPNLDYLREQVNGLKRLLDDPQPGLSSWQQMYRERMFAITDFWNGKPRK